MGIVYESQIHCECDKCGEIWMSSFVTLKQSKALLREKGWSIGKHVFCPKCKGKEEDNQWIMT